MNEKYLIEGHGFRNVTEAERTIGFEVGVRLAYYRGIALNILANMKLVVNGKVYEGDSLRLRIGERIFTMEQMHTEDKVRWEFDQAVTLRALETGGLQPGRHTVQLFETIKPAYMSGLGFTGEATRIMTLGDAAPLAGRGAQIKLGVSLYSYQEEYFTRAMSLDDCVAEVAAIGATGVQLIAEQMMRNYPNPGGAWLEKWHGLLAQHGVKPTLMDTFVDMDGGGHRDLSIKEGVDILITQMKLAKSLGFTMIRPTTGPVSVAAPELIRGALPYAEELDIRIAPELHAPIALRGPYVDSYLDLIAQTGTKHLGFTLDMGEFCRQLPAPLLSNFSRQGVRPDILDYLKNAFIDQQPHQLVMERVESMYPSAVDRRAAMRSRGFGPSTNEAGHILDYVPHIFNVHGKFYEMDENCVEASIPYREVLEVLVEGGYEGYIDSEYEGQRLTQDAFVTDSCEQVRRHHVMMRRELAKIS